MSARTPIAATDRVSDVLDRDESLVEVFVRHAAHFEKLRVRAMRRVMARLVTVEQAARMAGVPAERLVHDLNEALGARAVAALGAAAAVARGPAPAALVHPADAPVVEVDVREDLRAGREPFARIMAAVGALGDDEVLLLRAPFEPVPLLDVLTRRGFVYEVRGDAPDDWRVWFWRRAPRVAAAPPAPSAPPSPTSPAAPSDDADASDPTTVWLDVRGLQPPEPLMRTLAALDALPAGHRLVQVNERVPQLLLPMLAERGFACEVDDSRADRVLVRIWRPDRA